MKTIAGYPDYTIDREGVVRRGDRVITPKKSSKGYDVVALTHNGQTRQYWSKRLYLEAYYADEILSRLQGGETTTEVGAAFGVGSRTIASVAELARAMRAYKGNPQA